MLFIGHVEAFKYKTVIYQQHSFADSLSVCSGVVIF